jgi:hypothetical protein
MAADRRNDCMRFVVPALFLLTLASLPATAQQQASIPDNGRLSFRVMREESDIGSHELIFRRDGTRLDVEIAIDLKVTLLGISVYRYSHRAQETWESGRLIALETVTDDNGKPFKVSARISDSGFVVIANGSEAIFPADIFPSSHWNRAWIDKPLLNTQTGEKINYTAASRGSETIAIASGSLAAEHFTTAGDLRKDIWFDAAGRWAKSRFAAPDGSSISYVLQ